MRSPRELLWIGLLLAACGEAPDDETGGASTSSSSETSGSSSSSTGDAPTSTGDGPWDSLDERPCPEDSALSSENFGAPFLLTHCTGCHHSSLAADERAGAPVDVNFDALADVRAQAPRIWARAADQNATMPPLGAPSQEERTRLGEWLACGAPTASEL